MTWFLLILLVAVLLAILVPVVRLGIMALGTPGDRARANETLQCAAGLLGGRFRDRREYPWYRRPAQYGAVEGSLGDRGYELTIMPWNTEDAGGSAMLRIWARAGRAPAGGRPERVIFTSGQEWHWPDRADPTVLASYVRQAIATVNSGELPPAGPPAGQLPGHIP
jgi:hypothetical protein